MKFATLAILGAVSAQQFEDFQDEEVEEMINVLYPWDAVKEYGAQAKGIAKTAMPMLIKEKLMEKKFEKMEAARWAKIGPKYLPELEAWGKSKSVKAKKMFEQKVMMNAPKTKALFKAGSEVWEDVQDMTANKKWGKKMNKNGVVEWVNNEAAANLLEDIYEVKQALKALVESKMMKMNNKLGMQTLKDEHFQKIWAMFQEDEGFEGVDGMMKKLCRMVKKMNKMKKNCPIQRKLKQKIMKLGRTVMETRKVRDMPKKDDFEAWVKKNDFQPWADEEETELLDSSWFDYNLCV